MLTRSSETPSSFNSTGSWDPPIWLFVVNMAWVGCLTSPGCSVISSRRVLPEVAPDGLCVLVHALLFPVGIYVLCPKNEGPPHTASKGLTHYNNCISENKVVCSFLDAVLLKTFLAILTRGSGTFRWCVVSHTEWQVPIDIPARILPPPNHNLASPQDIIIQARVLPPPNHTQALAISCPSFRCPWTVS